LADIFQFITGIAWRLCTLCCTCCYYYYYHHHHHHYY